MSDTVASEARARLQRRVNRNIRSAVGLSKDPPPRCTDPDEAYFALDSVARLIHGDLPPMLVGGLGSLFIQMLHPHTMAGVAQHSRYREDPLGRLLQTANFIGFTTYGTKAQAYASIERVLAVHQVVRGIADDGVPYYANDPHLLAWVHAAETSMFLAAYRRYGTVRLSDADADRYVTEMATLA
ncbi:MAG TPA: oxygenase MpaB family protein, partial [Acidimicrobiales bacterium]